VCSQSCCGLRKQRELENLSKKRPKKYCRFEFQIMVQYCIISGRFKQLSIPKIGKSLQMQMPAFDMYAII